MKTYRADSGINHRLSIYRERSMPPDAAGKCAVKQFGKGVLKRLAAATSRGERGISRACKSTSKALSPLVERGKYAAGRKVSKLQAAIARVSSRNSPAPKDARTMARKSPAETPTAFDDLQPAMNHADHFNAVNDIRKLVTEFPATDPDVPAAVGAINELSKSLSEAGRGLDGVTHNQVTRFLEKAQTCDAPRLSGKAMYFLLRAQSRAPEALPVGPCVSFPERDREWAASRPAV